jgi:hypothetical protein
MPAHSIVPSPNIDGKPCAFSNKMEAKTWYYWRDPADGENRRQWYAAGGTGRAARTKIAALKARAANEGFTVHTYTVAAALLPEPVAAYALGEAVTLESFVWRGDRRGSGWSGGSQASLGNDAEMGMEDHEDAEVDVYGGGFDAFEEEMHPDSRGLLTGKRCVRTCITPGISILRGGLDQAVCADAALRIRARHASQPGVQIINGGPEDSYDADGRYGVRLGHNDPLCTSLRECLLNEGELEGRLPRDASGLVREEGCVKGPWHIVFPDRSLWPPELPQVPCTAWVVLERGASLEFGVMPSAIAFILSPDQLQVGDIFVLFDGDVPHRGVACLSSSNVSMHMYLDVPQVKRRCGIRDSTARSTLSKKKSASNTSLRQSRRQTNSNSNYTIDRLERFIG